MAFLVDWLLESPEAVVGVFALAVAVLGWRSGFSSFVARNSLELQRRVVDDPDLDKKLTLVARVSRQARESGKPNPWLGVARQPLYERGEDGRALVDVLNVFEEIAIGIRRGFYDEGVLYDSIRSIVVKLCCYTVPYIMARESTTHENVVWLGLRWYVRMRLSDQADSGGSVRRARQLAYDWERWGLSRTSTDPFSVSGASYLYLARLCRGLCVADVERDAHIRRTRLKLLRVELCAVFEEALAELQRNAG